MYVPIYTEGESIDFHLRGCIYIIIYMYKLYYLCINTNTN